MPQNTSRSHAILYDQFGDEDRFADWGADELFTRMPRRRPRVVADARPSRASSPRGVAGDVRPPRASRPRVAAGDTPPPRAPSTRALQLVESRVVRREAPAGEASVALAERPPARVPARVATGQPVTLPRPLPIVPAPRPRRTRSVGDWIGVRPERIVAWAFVLGLLLVLIAISTADAATA